MLGNIICDDAQINSLNTKEDFEKLGIDFNCDCCNIVEFMSRCSPKRPYGLSLQFCKDKRIFNLIIYFDIIQKRDCIIEIIKFICREVDLIYESL